MPIDEMVKNWRHLPVDNMPMNQIQAIHANLKKCGGEFKAHESEGQENFLQLMLRLEEQMGIESANNTEQPKKIESIVSMRMEMEPGATRF